MGKKSSTRPAAIAIELFRAWGREGGKKGAKARWAGVSRCASARRSRSGRGHCLKEAVTFKG